MLLAIKAKKVERVYPCFAFVVIMHIELFIKYILTFFRTDDTLNIEDIITRGGRDM